MTKTPPCELHDYISDVSERADVRAGSPLPFGAQAKGTGVNFAIFGRDARRVRLELFDHAEDAAPTRAIDLNPARNRTGGVWHVWVKGIGPGQLYAYRTDGPHEPACHLGISLRHTATTRRAESAKTRRSFARGSVTRALHLRAIQETSS